jgi:CHRD domain
MKKLVFYTMLACMVVFSSCDKTITEDVLHEESALKSAQQAKNFRAHLSGDQEVPANESLAQGQAIFQLSKDGTELSYKLIVANLDNVSASHIHIAPAGTNGGVVAFLYPSAPPSVLIPGTTNGVLAEGVIKASNLRGSLLGKPLSALIDAMSAGNAYVNAHTTAYPGGEIRGQIGGN